MRRLAPITDLAFRLVLTAMRFVDFWENCVYYTYHYIYAKTNFFCYNDLNLILCWAAYDEGLRFRVIGFRV
jgi:hypothetical protein